MSISGVSTVPFTLLTRLGHTLNTLLMFVSFRGLNDAAKKKKACAELKHRLKSVYFFNNSCNWVDIIGFPLALRAVFSYHIKALYVSGNNSQRTLHGQPS